MAMTPEEIEKELRRLSEAQRELDQRLKGRANPFNDLATQLELENGSLVSARTRRAQMTPVAVKTSGTQPQQIYLDGGTDDLIWMCAVPKDWVIGTAITVNTYLHQTATAGSPTAVMRSFIGLNKTGDTYDLDNFETDVNVNKTLTQNIVVLQSRTITGASIDTNDSIEWRLRREGADAGDTVNDSVNARGAWIEYTAFF